MFQRDIQCGVVQKSMATVEMGLGRKIKVKLETNWKYPYFGDDKSKRGQKMTPGKEWPAKCEDLVRTMLGSQREALKKTIISNDRVIEEKEE